MEHNWKEEKLICPNCKGDVIFRVAYKKAQHLNGKNWAEILKSAEVVISSCCGATVWISSIKNKAEM